MKTQENDVAFNSFLMIFQIWILQSRFWFYQMILYSNTHQIKPIFQIYLINIKYSSQKSKIGDFGGEIVV